MCTASLFFSDIQLGQRGQFKSFLEQKLIRHLIQGNKSFNFLKVRSFRRQLEKQQQQNIHFRVCNSDILGNGKV